MPLNTDSATAIVQFSGLGILCFNKRHQRAENLFIHAEKHTLSIGVYKPVSPAENDEIIAMGGKDGEIGYGKFSGYWHRLITSYLVLDRSDLNYTLDRVGLSIDVSGLGRPEINGFERYEPGSFSRTKHSAASAKKSEVDKNDFRWMVNAQKDKIFGNQALKPVIRPDVETTKLFIKNALFYTARIAETSEGELVFKKVPMVDDTGTEEAHLKALEKPAPFGKMASDIGAAISADYVVLRISVGDEQHVHTLPRTHRPYIIFINNSADPEDSGSDIPIYRSFFARTAQTFDVLTQSEIDKKRSVEPGGVISGREMCNGIVIDEPETIEPFG